MGLEPRTGWVKEDTMIDLFPKRMWDECAWTGNRLDNLNHFCIASSEETRQELVERLRANAIPIEDGPVLRWGANGTLTSVYSRPGG